MQHAASPRGAPYAYALSVPEARRPIAAHATAVPDIAQHARRSIQTFPTPLRSSSTASTMAAESSTGTPRSYRFSTALVSTATDPVSTAADPLSTGLTVAGTRRTVQTWPRALARELRPLLGGPMTIARCRAAGGRPVGRSIR
eukprot:269260-Rhodomonas_salina.1